ncbi:hypothetical protein ACOSP7_006795 [Xanthoceras sorbifolium]
MALDKYWGRNVKSKLQSKKWHFPLVGIATRPSLPRVAPQASQRKGRFKPMSIVTIFTTKGRAVYLVKEVSFLDSEHRDYGSR